MHGGGLPQGAVESPLMRSGDVWPRCVCTGGACLAFELAGQLGVPAAAEVLDFIAHAEPGARLTLQRNRDDITTQVVSPVRRADPGKITFETLAHLRRGLRDGHDLT